MKAVVISQRVDEIKEYGEIRDALDEQWHKLFQKMNAVLLPVPNISENHALLLDRIKPDAIVLSGGNTPVNYGGTAPQRDKTDEALIRFAVEKGIPLLGVCRGMQSVALFFDSSLKKVEGHVAVKHTVYVVFLPKMISSLINLPTSGIYSLACAKYEPLILSYLYPVYPNG
mgnify:CR=1 FL=1